MFLDCTLLMDTMSQIIAHEIVSNADTIISLRNPCDNFAEWGKPVPSSIAEIEEATFKLPSKKKKKRSKKDRQFDVPDSTLSLPTAGSVRFITANDTRLEHGQTASPSVHGKGDRKEAQQSLFGAESLPVLEAAAPAESAKRDENTAQDLEPVPTVMTQTLEEQQIQFRVCAGNLMSGSPWFSRILKKNGWMESNWDPEVRWFCILAEEWDEEAFVILMNIFHLRNKRVPRVITLEMLAKIAILADYYECDESIQLFVDIWVADLKEKSPIPNDYCRDMILWLWISWALRLSGIFEEVTAVVIRRSAEPVRTLALPIPSWVIGMCCL